MTESQTPSFENFGKTPPLGSARQVRAPEGWTELPLWDPFEAHMGPYFEQRRPEEGPGLDGDGERWFSFYVDDRHTNMAGICHGGMYLTFADAMLGWQANQELPCVTLSMQTQFLRPGQVGDLIQVKPELVRKTRSVLFIKGTFYIEGEPCFVANSLWKVIGAP